MLWPLFALVPGSGSRVTATVVLLSLLAWFAIEIRGGDMLGLSERALAAGEAMWPLVVVISLLRRDSAAVRATQPAARAVTSSSVVR